MERSTRPRRKPAASSSLPFIPPLALALLPSSYNWGCYILFVRAVRSGHNEAIVSGSVCLPSLHHPLASCCPCVVRHFTPTWAFLSSCTFPIVSLPKSIQEVRGDVHLFLGSCPALPHKDTSNNKQNQSMNPVQSSSPHTHRYRRRPDRQTKQSHPRPQAGDAWRISYAFFLRERRKR